MPIGPIKSHPTRLGEPGQELLFCGETVTPGVLFGRLRPANEGKLELTLSVRPLLWERGEVLMMSTKLLVLTIVGAVSVSAFAGGYVAVRHNTPGPGVVQVEASPEPTVSAAVPAPAPLTPPEPSVSESRAIRPAERPAPRARSAKPTPVRSASTKAVETTASGGSAQIPAVAPAPVADAPIPEASGARNDSSALPDPPKPRLEELTVAPDSVIGIRLDSTISSETARVEDRVTARVSRDVVVSGHTAISAGARVEGVVTAVERGSKFKERSRIGVRFQSLVLADGTRFTIQTETIFREGVSPAEPAASKIGASAAVGGILGAILGGKKGAAIGSTVGAAGGTAAVMSGASLAVILQAGTPLTVRLTAPVTVTIERQEEGIEN